MADDGDVKNKIEVEKVDNSEAAVVTDGDSEESEEESLVYDRCNSESSEESGIVNTRVLIVLIGLE